MCWGLAFLPIISSITACWYEYFAGLSRLSMAGVPPGDGEGSAGISVRVGQAGGGRDAAAAGSALPLSPGLPFKQPSLAVMAGSHGDER